MARSLAILLMIEDDKNAMQMHALRSYNRLLMAARAAA